MNTREALALAKEKGLDLVEVAATARPPVCKILDYGKLKYTKKKKTQEAKKKQTVVSIKEIQLRPRTEDHDLETKFRHLAEFLTYGDKVKITVMFRGREVAYAHQGQQMLLRIIESVKDIAAPEQYPKLEGRRMIMVLGPTGKPSENIDKLPALVSLSSLKPKAFEGRIDRPEGVPGGLPVPGSAPGSLPVPGSAPGAAAPSAPSSLPIPGSAPGSSNTGSGSSSGSGSTT
jgi:translation initiation factor IF-3